MVLDMNLICQDSLQVHLPVILIPSNIMSTSFLIDYRVDHDSSVLQGRLQGSGGCKQCLGAPLPECLPPTLWLSLHGHPSPACLLPLPCVSPAPFLPHSHIHWDLIFLTPTYTLLTILPLHVPYGFVSHMSASSIVSLCTRIYPYTVDTAVHSLHKPSAAHSVPCAGCASSSKLAWLSGKSVASHVPCQLCSSPTQESFLMLQSSHVKSDVLHAH